MIRHITYYRQVLAPAMALCLLLIAAAFLAGCTNGDSTATTERPQPTATSTGAPDTATATPTDAVPATETATPSNAAPATETATPSRPPVQVVATSNIVGDWAKVIGGDRVEVFSLLPPGGDPHNFVPSARDVARVADADVVFTIGLSLEAEWLEDLIHNASADESKIVALGEGVDPIEFAAMVGMHDDHGDEGDDHHDELAIGRLLVADAVEAHLSVIDLETDNIDSGIFEVAAPRATVYPSPSHRYGIVLARGPEDGDDRVHVFDGGVFLVEHGDHYDLVQEPVSRHSLEITEERPIHYVNSHGWTAIFADAQGHAILINEADLANSSGDYEPIVFEAGPQHGAALVISDEHVVITNKNLDDLDDALPVGVEVRDFDDHVVYDASNRSCPGMHGESHNEHGAAFGCIGGVLFLEAHDGEYEHKFITNPPEMREDSRIGSVYGHHHVEHFFGRASYRDDQGFADDGIWLIDVDHSEMRQVFSEPSVSTKFSSDGERLYVLGADGVLHVLHVLDAHDGDLVATMDLVEPGESGRPAFIVVGEMMYVADPNSGHVLGVHLEEMEIEEEWELGGAPSSLAFVGVADSGGAPDEGHVEHGDEGHDEGHEEDEHGHDHGTLDPHFWFDPIRVKAAVNEIAARLSAVDSNSASVYYQNASDYAEHLDELHSWTQEQVKLVPPERRLLVTSHDTFSYFAALYGFEVIGLIIPSLATHIEPSGEHVAEVVEVVREHNAPAVFSETTVSAKVPEAVARETGAVLVRLYTGSLGETGSVAGTYLGMVRTNVELIVEALR